MIENVLNWLVHQVEAWGYVGIFAMMFLESTFFPFPSEVAMIPAGYLAYEGRMSASLAIAAGLGGSLGGALLNYWLARRVGLPFLRRWGRWIFFDESKLERCNVIFRRHGEITTFVCRLIPLVRQYISLPAGLARMSLSKFSIYTGLGAGIWVAVLTAFGYWVGDALSRLEHDPTWEDYHAAWERHESTLLLGIGVPLLVLIIAYIVVFKWRKRRRDAAAAPQSETEPR